MKFTFAFPLLVSNVVAFFAPNPVTRVVELLEDLSKKVESEKHTEKKQHDNFKCWVERNTAEQEAIYEKSQRRQQELRDQIDNLEAHEEEDDLTTERGDLKKEINELQQDIDLIESKRRVDNKQFEASMNEMEQAITALSSALDVLKTATGEKKTAFLAVNAGTFQARALEAGTLQSAIDLSSKILSAGDAEFLRRLLTADVPERDWKELNKKADFKNKYEARSGKIQAVLQKLLSDVDAEKEEAQQKETEDAENHDRVILVKTTRLGKLQKDLTEFKKEKSARNLSIAEKEEEFEALEKTMNSNRATIDSMDEHKANMEAEFKARTNERDEELEAISKAIEFLRSDESRDLLARTVGASFLQVSSSKFSSVSAVLKHAAGRDSRMLRLAAKAQTGHFNQVLQEIKNMVGILKEEEGQELNRVKDCRKARRDYLETAANAARDADEEADTVTALEASVAEHKENKEDLEKQNKELEESKKEASAMRQDEKTAFDISQEDSREAVEVLNNAKGALEAFYANSKFIQTSSNARETPADAPALWDSGSTYTGASSESKNIISMLSMIIGDIQKEKDGAVEAEEAAAEEFKNLTQTMTEEQNANDREIQAIDTSVASEMNKLEQARSNRQNHLQQVRDTQDGISKSEPGCSFLIVNHPVRTENRRLEMDGLMKALGILETYAGSGLPQTKSVAQFIEVHRH